MTEFVDLAKISLEAGIFSLKCLGNVSGHATVDTHLVVGDVYFLHHFREVQVKLERSGYLFQSMASAMIVGMYARNRCLLMLRRNLVDGTSTREKINWWWGSAAFPGSALDDC